MEQIYWKEQIGGDAGYTNEIHKLILIASNTRVAKNRTGLFGIAQVGQLQC
jgi:hypothetical protein